MRLSLILILSRIMKFIQSIDYCTTRTNPMEPNDCVYFSTHGTKCCFNPIDNQRCYLEKTAEGLLCDEDYFYKISGEDRYNNNKNKNGKCIFSIKDIKGGFNYNEKNKQDLFEISENGLEIKCLKSEYINLKFIFSNFIVFFLFIS